MFSRTSEPASKYVALGDSMGISLYPELDAEAKLGRRISGLGAAALLLANNDDLWPEFKGRDLSTLRPDLGFLDLASDGAMIPDVDWQLRQLRGEKPVIMTLTIGGNDLLEALFAARDERKLSSAVDRICSSYEQLLVRIRKEAPAAVLVLTTVYDPTDGTGRMPGIDGVLPVHYLHSFNDGVRSRAAATSNARLADVHQHFLGHGVTASADTRWYWSESIIEPSMTGASEIRRMWLEAIMSERRE